MIQKIKNTFAIHIHLVMDAT